MTPLKPSPERYPLRAQVHSLIPYRTDRKIADGPFDTLPKPPLTLARTVLLTPSLPKPPPLNYPGTKTVLLTPSQKNPQTWATTSTPSCPGPADKAHHLAESEVAAHLMLEGFRWSVGLVARILCRTIGEGWRGTEGSSRSPQWFSGTNPFSVV